MNILLTYRFFCIVESITGYSSTFIFRWKGGSPSTVLRLEINLFSGFELTTTPPQLLNPPQDMAEMQHGSNDNKLWFIFANITTTCPVCVQFTARSIFVITGLRPAYTKIYPATREDLAAETFFHAKYKSSLLKSVTSDDMITWFGLNRTNDETFQFPVNCKPKNLYGTTAINPFTYNLTMDESMEASPVPHKINVISVSTYTINVDNSSITNLTDEKELGKESFTENPMEINFDTTSSFPIVSQKLTDKMIQENLIPEEDNIKFVEELTTVDNILEENNTAADTDNEINTESVIVTSETTHRSEREVTNIEIMPALVSTTDIIITQTFDQNPTEGHRISELTIPSPIKHVNKEEVHTIPTKYEKSKKEIGEKMAFAPEIKNDQYILLNKEALWGMLKEVVDDEFRRNVNSKIIDAEKLRKQGFT